MGRRNMAWTDKIKIWGRMRMGMKGMEWKCVFEITLIFNVGSLKWF
jgi:hypothetical protein